MPCPIVLERIRAFGLFCGLVALGACGPATLPSGDQTVDRDEAQNRAIHEFNVSLDRSVIGSVSRGYGTAVPAPVRRGVDNFTSNLSQPSYVLNNLLQFRIGQAAQNTSRFLINSTIGLGGLFDPATAMGVPAAETDFGETLHIYGVPEGAFVMLPVLGPSTSRDTVGLVVDVATNPVRYAFPVEERRYISGFRVADGLGERYEADGVLTDIYDNSADSYAQLRSLYLQNRRFELGGAALDFGDIYVDPSAGGETTAEPAAAPSVSDPYSDPYLDPYAP